MDPIMRAWMFHSWAEDYADENKMLENQGYLIGSFINPELDKRMLGKGSETFESSSDEFEESSRKVLEINKELDAKKDTRRRRRRKIKE